MKASVLLALCAVFCLRADAEEARISIPELLNPETRLRAFQQFVLNSEPKEAKEHRWNDLQEFESWHDIISVAELKAGGERPKYLLVWDTAVGRDDAWDDPGSPRLEGVLGPRESAYYQIFAHDGTPAGDRSIVMNAIVADINGDGEVEEVEWASSNDAVVPALDADDQTDAAAQKEAIAVDYLTIQSAGDPYRPGTTVIYNTHPVSRAHGDVWGAQLADRDKDGLFEVELGPVVDLLTIDVKASLRWDTSTKKWVGPAQKPGDHYAVIEGKSSWDLTIERTRPSSYTAPVVHVGSHCGNG